MSNLQSTGRPQARLHCKKCGSNYVQTVEAAYSQSVRTSQRGHTTVSGLGESIRPPEQRAIGGPALLVAFGVGSFSWLFAGTIETKLFGTNWLGDGFFDPANLALALIVAIAAATISIRSSVRYNAEKWLPQYRAWRRGRICRSCLHQFSASNDDGQ